MPVREQLHDGTLPSTSAVELVPAPPPKIRRTVKLVTIHAPSGDGGIDCDVFVDNDGSERNLYGDDIVEKYTLHLCGPFVLDTPDKSLKARLASAPSTPYPWTVTYVDSA